MVKVKVKVKVKVEVKVSGFTFQVSGVKDVRCKV
jgi:hypothetical protein